VIRILNLDVRLWAFWISAMLVVYTYLGYPLWLRLRRIWRMRPVHTAPHFPTISIVMAVRNEQEVLQSKLANLRQLNYPVEKCEIVVVSDGSTDQTEALLQTEPKDRLRAIAISEHVGKAEALNRAVREARGEIIVFTDARQMLEAESVRIMMENFADPEVGCVSGELMLGSPVDPRALRGVGLYWKLERTIRQWESLTGSVVGATGAFYAARRELVGELPPHTILDDVYLPMNVVRQRRRVAFEPRARAWDIPPAIPRAEFERKVRTLTGNYQLLQLAPWLLTKKNPLRFEFVSHKILRLIAPFALICVLVLPLTIGRPYYRALALIQVLFYASAILALTPIRLGGLGRLGNVTLTFILMNTAAVVALINFLTGKKRVWAR
jgi:poly-beta-1,6-N-acetyl-D-glucosamine synthase